MIETLEFITGEGPLTAGTPNPRNNPRYGTVRVRTTGAPRQGGARGSGVPGRSDHARVSYADRGEGSRSRTSSMDWVAVQSRVLLVEDVRDVRLLVRTALAAAGGFSLTEADTGATAVGLAGAERPDVIVLDLGLPDLAAEDVLVGL